ncbi:facilitated trehalose transporter Tret1-like [Coccinella septempunctata]|uniref:facilitated trehalose transporter Tret1-like n=1 Tax=Coccinella septempunctata TaxID=41139 RepID=UPI001D0726CD|nr:facilitated trehalose transporter Tret1-like [Coccinella septempunctata]
MKTSATMTMGKASKNKQSATLAWRSSLSQILAVSVKNFVLLGYGMTLGFPTLLIPVLSSHNTDEPFSLGEEGLSWVGSISMICVPFGCFMSGMLTQPLGRRRSMQLINIPFVAAWLLFYFSSEIWHIFVGLALAGLSGGLMEAPVLTYVAEITQPHLRGILSSTSSMSVIGGSMIQFILATFLNWRTVALVSAFVPIIPFCLLFLIPETPIWLLSKKRYVEAKESLAWLRGWVSIEEIDKEYNDLFDQVQTSRGIGNEGFQADNGTSNPANTYGQAVNTEIRKRTKLETVKLFKKRNFIVPYLLVSFVFFLSHFNGLSPVQTYAVSIFSSFKAPIDKYHATALLGVVEVIGCITCVSLVHYFGKRVLTFLSLGGTAICFLVIGTYAHLANITSLLSDNSNSTVSNITSHIIERETSGANAWLPMILFIIAAFFSHMGIRVLPWILTGEIFPNEIRAIASGIAATSFYVFGFICNKVFLSMVSGLTLPGTFWFFSSMSFLGLIVLFFTLPETEGKTLHDITNHFAGKMKLGNNVLRNNEDSGYSFHNEGFVDDNKNKSDVESKF